MRTGTVAETAATFLRLGCTSFGGPVAHLGYIHEACVVRRGWLDEAEYADLVALCQFLPGPASSQLVFAIGMKRAGLAGALAASAAFTLPSAILMIAFAYGVTALGGLRHAGWLHGLKVAAVAVVAQAVWSMGRKLCPEAPRLLLAGIAAAFVLSVPGAFAQIGAIALGGAAGARWWRDRNVVGPERPTPQNTGRTASATGALVVFAALLLVLPALAATGGTAMKLFDSFYRSGALVFGGGHVVLPLLRAELVPPGYIGDDAFLAGYGAAQAVPGPLFTFAAYLGTAIRGGATAWIGGLGALLAIFLPAWLIVGGALPFWNRLRSRPGIRATLTGANAAVVGVLLAALWNPVIREGILNAADIVAAVAAFAALEFWKKPAWVVVACCALAGAVAS